MSLTAALHAHIMPSASWLLRLAGSLRPRVFMPQASHMKFSPVRPPAAAPPGPRAHRACAPPLLQSPVAGAGAQGRARLLGARKRDEGKATVGVAESEHCPSVSLLPTRELAPHSRHTFVIALPNKLPFDPFDAAAPCLPRPLLLAHLPRAPPGAAPAPPPAGERGLPGQPRAPAPRCARRRAQSVGAAPPGA
jgi:hypothetical protein